MNDLVSQELLSPLEREKLTFEREKWQAEQRRLDRDFELREKELALKQREARRSAWWNPLFIAILGASIAAGGSAYVSWENTQGNLRLETFKAESARIFEVVKTGNPDLAAKNLSFLLEAGLIQNPATADNIREYLAKRRQGEGVSLPAERPTSGQPFGDLYARNLNGADLHGQDLHGRNLSFASLRGANLRGADLHDADLNVADLADADLSGADLRHATLRGAEMLGAKLTDANLDGAILLYTPNLTQDQLNQACGSPVLAPESGLYLTRDCPSKGTVAPALNPRTRR